MAVRADASGLWSYRAVVAVLMWPTARATSARSWV